MTARLISFSGSSAALARLVAALSAVGKRVGWLDLGIEAAPPPELAAPIAAGAFKAVAAGGRLTVVAKRRRGAVVVRDLVREQFAGCSVVLVANGDGHPRLAAESGELWIWSEAPGRSERCDLERVLARLAERARR